VPSACQAGDREGAAQGGGPGGGPDCRAQVDRGGGGRGGGGGFAAEGRGGSCGCWAGSSRSRAGRVALFRGCRAVSSGSSVNSWAGRASSGSGIRSGSSRSGALQPAGDVPLSILRCLGLCRNVHCLRLHPREAEEVRQNVGRRLRTQHHHAPSHLPSCRPLLPLPTNRDHPSSSSVSLPSCFGPC
jgi:hypothetical protein